MKSLKLIHKKFFFFIICLAFIVCFSSSTQALDDADRAEVDLSGPETALQAAMDKLFNLIDAIEKDKGLNEKEKTKKVFNSIKNARWGPEKNNYFWVIDLDGNMIGEPVCIDMEGRSITDYAIIDYKDDPDAKRIFVDLIKTCNEKGQVFFQYLMPECRRDPADIKIALARMLVYKKWIIITGIYRDTIEAYQEPIEPDFFVPIDDPGSGREIIDDSEPASGT